ncbi:MAG: hypothetical protein IPN80_00025 [Flavobacterium sp.]|nr:hypothetical protein [Flavobacterium sp.]
MIPIRRARFFVLTLLLCINKGKAQPYVDIANFNYQNFSSTNKGNPELKNNTDIYALGVFLPHELKNGNTLFFRINSELIQTSISPRLTAATKVSSISLPIGYQWISKNKKWKSLLIGIPKLATDFKSSIGSEDFQYGMLFIENYKLKDKLQIKLGFYFNEEAFGHFFVPLVGVDWKPSDRWQFFGILPTNYKIEYAIQKKKWYTGINFKALTRSFQLSESQNNDYVRFDEVVLKSFIEYYCFNNIMAYAEIGQSLGNPPLQYKSDSDQLSNTNSSFSNSKNYLIFSIGLAYRIRND